MTAKLVVLQIGQVFFAEVRVVRGVNVEDFGSMGVIRGSD